MTVSVEDVKRIRLFFVSYAPLWAMLGFRSFSDHFNWHQFHSYIPILFLSLAAVSVIDGWRLVNGAQRKSSITARFDNVQEQGAVAGAYLATYILPFLGMTVSGVGGFFAYVTYILVVAVVFVRSDLALVNPTLYVMGWHIVSAVRVDHGLSQASVVVCRNVSALVREVVVVQLAGGYVIKNENNQISETSP